MSKLGKVVLYNLDKEDERKIIAMRANGLMLNLPDGQLPAIVVGDFGGDTVNLNVFHDGYCQPMWKTSVKEGTGPAQWQEINANAVCVTLEVTDTVTQTDTHTDVTDAVEQSETSAEVTDIETQADTSAEVTDSVNQAETSDEVTDAVTQDDSSTEVTDTETQAETSAEVTVKDSEAGQTKKK